MPEELMRQYLFDRPGYYRIRVLGVLDERWLGHLESLEISTSTEDDGSRVTQISGWLPDQTALSGLLDLLNDLGLVILAVERIELHEEIELLKDVKENENEEK